MPGIRLLCSVVLVLLIPVRVAEANSFTLYGTVGNDSVAPSRLVTINASTGAVAFVAALAVSMPTLAYDSLRGRLYGTSLTIDVNGTASASDLYVINPLDGGLTLVGSLGVVNNMALGYDSINDRLYGASNDSFFSIDPGTAQMTLLGSFSTPGHPAVREMTFDAASGLMYLDTEGVSESGSDLNGLNIVNLANGALTFVGTFKGPSGPSHAFNNLRAIEYDASGQRLVGISNQSDPFGGLVHIDTSTGVATVLTGTTERNIRGLAFVPPVPVPEPATFVLLGSGLAWIVRQRRAVGRR